MDLELFRKDKRGIYQEVSDKTGLENSAALVVSVMQVLA